MKVVLTGVEIDGIADRLAHRLQSVLKPSSRRSALISRPAEAQSVAVDATALDQIQRALARELAPIVCPEDSLLSAQQARSLMGIRKSKWHELRRDGKIPDPVRSICGDRWYRSAVLRCMAIDIER